MEMILEPQFDEANSFVAANSLKPVIIRKVSEDEFFLDMPKGDLNIDAPIMNMYFETLKEAMFAKQQLPFKYREAWILKN